MALLAWTERPLDCRSGRVVFLAHCLLNQNTRYPGGACRPGAIREIVDVCVANGLGIVQMPCPEACAWGGVRKRRLLSFLACDGSFKRLVRRALLPVALGYTRWVYRRLARRIAVQVADYRRSQMSVVAIVGVDRSPSCGVTKTLDVPRAVRELTTLKGSAGASDVNAALRRSTTDGCGLFTAALQRALRRRGAVDFVGHDLIAELDGTHAYAVAEALLPPSDR